MKKNNSNVFLFQTILFCSMECNKRDFCSTWWIVDSECVLSNFVVSPQDGAEDTDTITCYSNRRSGNEILKATASNSPVLDSRSASLLTKGIYNYNFGTSSSAVVPDVNPFMLFEFESPIRVKIIRLRTSSSEGGLPSPQTEIRLGSSMLGGPSDFSQLKLIGTWDNPKVDEWKFFLLDSPVEAKFMAILEADGTKLALTFIEVFS